MNESDIEKIYHKVSAMLLKAELNYGIEKWEKMYPIVEDLMVNDPTYRANTPSIDFKNACIKAEELCLLNQDT